MLRQEKPEEFSSGQFERFLPEKATKSKYIFIYPRWYKITNRIRRFLLNKIRRQR